MPISSTPNQHLTPKFYRPPPKSLDEVIWEAQEGYGVDGFSAPTLPNDNGANFSNNHGKYRQTHKGSKLHSRNKKKDLRRESHLKDLPFKKQTAVVGPLTEGGKKSKYLATDGGTFSVGDKSKKSAAAGSVGSAPGCVDGCGSCMERCGSCAYRWCWCFRHGVYCSRCAWWTLLLGLLLGALVTGLLLGILLGSRLEATEAALEEAQNTGCFQSPCSSASATCGYSSNNTQINCICNDGDPESTAPVTSDAYNCTLYNITTTSTTATP